MTITSFERLVDLYNGPYAVAERAEKNWLEYLHVATPLEDSIQTWIAAKSDVILTGSPGDGKTHLINILEQRGMLGASAIERDASQREIKSILDVWQIKKLEGVPFLLAINHAPLIELAVEAETYNGLHHLKHLPIEVDNTIFYNEASSSDIASTVVVDLGRREVLSSEFVYSLAQKMCRLISNSPCTTCPLGKCPVEYNAAALSNRKVLDNLITLLSLVARRGFHATMRDLTGLFAYIFTGGKTCAVRWQPPDNDDDSVPHFDEYAYYNLLFSGRNNLFEAIRATFDPAAYTDPKSDMELWEGEVRKGWLVPSRVISPPSTLEDLRSLKRRYFFEHEHSTEELLRRMLPTSAHGFDALVRGDVDDHRAVEELIDMINMFYAPWGADQRTAQPHSLRLWHQHRYAIGGVKGYMAMRSISSEALTLYRPKMAPKLERALKVRRDHVLLGGKHWKPGDAGIRIDWLVYHALDAARTGTPIDMQPFHVLHRLDTFLSHLRSHSTGLRYIETIEWSDRLRRSQLLVRVNRSTRRYE